MTMPATLICVTGPVGAGKSTVLEWLAGRGAATLDADDVTRSLLADDSPLAAAVVERFGGDVASPAGVDRAILAERVFADPRALHDLEALLHPPVGAAIEAWLGAVGADVAVVEGIKIVESPLRGRCDTIWLICADRDVRRQRLAHRWPRAEVEKRLAASPPLARQLAAAAVVIDNSGPWHATEAQLRLAWRGFEHQQADGRQHARPG